MMKRIISMGLMALVLLNFLIAVDLVHLPKVKAEQNEPFYDPGLGYWKTNGTWVVEFGEIKLHSAKTIVVNGHLIIEDNAQLTLQNVTLLMNCSYDGEFNITVSRGLMGGYLIIEDLAGDPSVITSYRPGTRFGFHVQAPNPPVETAGGRLRMTNSELHECGWSVKDAYWLDAGLNIQSSNVIIEGSDISYNYRGITLHGDYATGVSINNNTIHDNQATGIWMSQLSYDNHIADNEIYLNEDGIRINSSLNTVFDRTEIINNDIIDNTNKGVYLEDSSNVLIQGNTINNHTGSSPTAGTGIYLSTTSQTTVHDNYLENNAGDFDSDANAAIFVQGGNQIKLTNNYVTDSNRFVIRTQFLTDIEAENNQCIDNLGSGANMIFVAISNSGVVNNNTVQNAGWSGIFIDGCNNFRVTNNTVDGVYASGGLSAPVGLVQQSTSLSNFATLNSIYDYNNHINNIASTTGGVGMTLSSGTDHVVDRTIVSDCDSVGMLLSTDNTTIKHSYVSQIGITSAASDPDVAGIALAGDNIVFHDNTIVDCQVTPDGTYPVNGLLISGATNSVIKNSYFNGSEVNIYGAGAVNNVIIDNSTLNQDFDTKLDFYLSSGARLTTLNTSFNNGSVNFGDANSELIVKWYLDVEVTNTVGNPEQGADVWVNDTFGTNEVNGTTGASGWLRWNPVTEYVHKNSGKTVHTPHNITAKKDTRVGVQRPEIKKSQGITVKLNNIPEVIDLTANASNVYRAYPLEIRANGQDVEDSEGSLEPYFEYRVNSSSPWIGETDPGSYFDSGSQTYSGGVWIIIFIPPVDAPIDAYEFRVRFGDSYPMNSSWEEGLIVDVMNNHPVVVYINEDDDVMYRGESVFIFADASDIEDIDEDEGWSAKIEHQFANSTGWSNGSISMDGYDSFSGDWKFEFSPDKTRPNPKTGPVDFRVKFWDTDGDESVWYYAYDLIVLLNKIPVVDNLKSGLTEIYRGESTWVFANGSDAEEDEGILFVEFYYDLPGGGINWIQDNFVGGTKEYDTFANLWKIKFNAPKTDPLGDYYFMVRVTDSDGDYDEEVGGLNGKVNVMNNLPSVIDVKASAPEVGVDAGFIYINVNATDPDGDVSDLSLIVEHRFGNDPWNTDFISGSTSYDSQGWLKIKFEPTDTDKLGDYDFRVKVMDKDNGLSTDWIQEDNIVSVWKIFPTLEDITLGATEVNRGDTIYIIVNANDPILAESELTIEVRYEPPSGGWIDITSQPTDYDSTQGHWKIPFTPGYNSEVGTYKFKGRVYNGRAYSDEGTYVSTSNNAEVKNNLPETVSLEADATEVMRGGEIYIWGKGTDLEDGDGITAVFRYRPTGGNWDDTYLTNLRNPSGSETRWRITFAPPADDDFTLGDYDFQVLFEDDDGDPSTPKEGAALVQVKNVEPTADAISVPTSSGFRLQPLIITADGTDDDHGEAGLTATFQYSSDGVNWVGSDESGSYFQDSPTYINQRWQITFTPPADAALGQYSFRVQFSDGEETSDWVTKNNAYEVQNSEPEVEITSPAPGEQQSLEVSFSASADDEEDPNTLEWEWDFDGDGEIDSTEESPTHKYDKPGPYTVTVTVTDGDGDSTSDTIPITIKGADDGDGGFDMMTLLLLLIPFIAIILVLVIMLTRTKKKPDEVPPMAPEAVPEVTEAAPSEAPSTAVSAAAPATAAPTAAGQQIKCPNCGTAFNVESTERPITIECPNCHTKGQLT
jgi:parallel beta-helix repeat protein